MQPRVIVLQQFMVIAMGERNEDSRELSELLQELYNDAESKSELFTELKKGLDAFASKGLQEALRTEIKKVHEEAVKFGSSVFKQKGEFNRYFSINIQLPRSRSYDVRNRILTPKRPWSRVWMGLRNSFWRLDKRTNGNSGFVGAVLNLFGGATAFALLIVLLIESAPLAAVLLAGGATAFSIALPVQVLKDRVIVRDLSIVKLESVHQIKKQLDASGFAGKMILKSPNHDPHSVQVEIWIRYTPKALKSLGVK